METKARKKTLNIVMVILIAVVVGCGIMAVGSLKGWFSQGGGQVITDEVTGVANIERSSVAYTLEEDVLLERGDIVETKNDSRAYFKMGRGNELAMSANTEMTIPECGEESLELHVAEGEVFIALTGRESDTTFGFGGLKGNLKEGILSLSAQKGSGEVSIYEGSCTMEFGGEEITLKQGDKLIISGEDKAQMEEQKIDINTLNQFQIDLLKRADSKEACFTSEQLDKVVADREAEKKEADKALQKEALVVIEENSKDESSGNDSKDGKESTKTSSAKTCTVQIQCKSILSNMDKLKEGKNRYVPSNGIILATSKVEFKQGETAYDVTKRACSATGIQIEAAYTPAYGSYYVEGINHLYEFDCGELSGWMYKVNGWAPNYGSSEYELKDGDNIVWYYTCTGR